MSYDISGIPETSTSRAISTRLCHIHTLFHSRSDYHHHTINHPPTPTNSRTTPGSTTTGSNSYRVTRQATGAVKQKKRSLATPFFLISVRFSPYHPLLSSNPPNTHTMYMCSTKFFFCFRPPTHWFRAPSRPSLSRICTPMAVSIPIPPPVRATVGWL